MDLIGDEIMKHNATEIGYVNRAIFLLCKCQVEKIVSAKPALKKRLFENS